MPASTRRSRASSWKSIVMAARCRAAGRARRHRAVARRSQTHCERASAKLDTSSAHVLAIRCARMRETDRPVGRCQPHDRTPDDGPPRSRRAEPEPPRADPGRRVPHVRDAWLPRDRGGRHRRAPRRRPRAASTSTSRPRKRSSASSWRRRRTSSSAQGGAGRRARDRARRAGRGGDPDGARDVRRATGRWPGCCSSTRSGAGRVFQAETNALHERFARLIQGYLDEAVAAGAARRWTPGSRASPGSGRSTRSSGRWLLADAAGPPRGRVPGAARGAAPERGRLGRARSARSRCPPAGWDFPEPLAVTAVQPAGHGRRHPRRRDDEAAGLGERLAGAARRGCRAAPRWSPRPSRPPAIDPISLVAAAMEADLEVALWLRPSEGTALRRHRAGLGRSRPPVRTASTRPRRRGATRARGARMDRGGADAPAAGPRPARCDGLHRAGARRRRPVGPVRGRARWCCRSCSWR